MRHLRIREAALLSTLLVLLNFGLHYTLGVPLLTDRLAEWIMAHTPNAASIWILETFGDWAKPLAATGGLATIGVSLWIILQLFRAPAFVPDRRHFLTTGLMLGGTAAVALESFVREKSRGAAAVQPHDLFPFQAPPDSFARGLVRPPVTPVGNFYVMSKNTVDPLLTAEHVLKITQNGRTLREIPYRELLDLSREHRWQTLRCVSNTLKSDLMGTAEWLGVRLSQIVPECATFDPDGEVAVLGIDGHGDSFTVGYANSEEPMIAVGMNGKTLNRQHGYPMRLLAPRFYGFKSVKWIAEIALTRTPYFGTWPKMGYTKNPVIHTCSFVDRIKREGNRLAAGGAAFAGVRGIQRVRVRAGGATSWSPWVDATLEAPLSKYTLTRWRVELNFPRSAEFVEARAQDGTGEWQQSTERPIFPDGMAGPTLRRIPS